MFAVREGSLERWELGGKLTVSTDDLIRGIAAQAPTEAMAFLTPSVIELGGLTRRCDRMLVERAGRVGQFVLPVETKDGKIQSAELKYHDEGRVPAGGQWIGVAPETPCEPDGRGGGGWKGVGGGVTAGVRPEAARSGYTFRSTSLRSAPAPHTSS